jgi:lysophospholipase L1-like esterase
MQAIMTHIRRAIYCTVLALGATAFGYAQADAAHIAVKPGEVIAVSDEPLVLGTHSPVGYTGTPLPTLLTGNPTSGLGRVTEHGALIAGSLVIKKGDRVLTLGKDYLLDPAWGTVGIGPAPSVTATETVTASYRYALLRLDSVVKTKDGKQTVRTGVSHITTPHPPDLQPGETRIANILVPYNSDGTDVQVFPVVEDASKAVTGSTAGRIPKTLAKLKAGLPVTIVTWGDSLTAGGDASSPYFRYPSVIERMLRAEYPKADIHVVVAGAGGSTSRQWLYPDKFPYGGPLSWDRVVASHPDLITVEFSNDNFISNPETLPAIYDDILGRIQKAGAEVILMTPSYMDFNLMQFKSYSDPDKRLIVSFYHQLAEQHHLALADDAARWGHLYKEGLPYTTLLVNSYNHPDNRGHQMFADELFKCFQ